MMHTLYLCWLNKSNELQVLLVRYEISISTFYKYLQSGVADAVLICHWHYGYH